MHLFIFARLHMQTNLQLTSKVGLQYIKGKSQRYQLQIGGYFMCLRLFFFFLLWYGKRY